jgi:transcriptional regulator with GAF, ATPase, and Fis domain
VLQEREYMRIGGTQNIKTNARIVSATNRDLLKDIRDKKFREDLFYRINVVPIHMPPLRDRREDIPLLVHHFMDFFRQSMNAAATEVAPDAMERLSAYGWPGNVRELRNIVERILVLNHRKKAITLDCLPEEFHPHGAAPAAPAAPILAAAPDAASGVSLEDSVNAYERDLVLRALKQANGVQTRAAEMLGTTRRILKYRMDKLNIQDPSAAATP